ncbi:class I SAM-dependent methyltransferase [Nibricoccus sp. IMCC34717]|uniref:class I SAM-dependent methyltransferase n=1 Tax=Nibricoccus sp. IMCC34717 TaxID=3034021 RepID=UPI003850E57A
MNSLEYTRLAAAEDEMWYFRALHAHLLKGVEGVLGEAGQLRLLDAGCGTGGFLRRLARQRPLWEAQGVDRSGEACALARARGAAPITEATLEALPFADNFFDAVVSADVFYQVEEPAVALRELRRVLRPGGALVLTAPAYPWLWSYHDEAVGGRRRFTRRALRELLAENGFNVVRLTHWNALTFPAIVWKRKVSRSENADTGDVALGPRWLEAILRSVMALERAVLRLGVNWPWGANLVVTGERTS